MFEFDTPIEIRFVDLDAYGHVNNAVFFTYLETARVKLFQQRFGSFLESGLLFLVVRAECDYRLPIQLDDQLHISIAVVQIKHSSFEFDYRLHNSSGKLFAEAKTMMVSYDPEAKRPVAIPVRLKAILKGER